MRRETLSRLGRALAAVAVYLGIVGVASAVALISADRLATAWLTADARPTAAPLAVAARAPTAITTIRHASMIPTSDDWAEKLRDPAYWAKLKSGAGAGKVSNVSKPSEPQRMNLGAKPTQPSGPSLAKSRDSGSAKSKSSRDDDDDGDETYRTMCVRACDGAFFPVSFATTRDNFEADQAKCDKTCTGAKLYVYRNPGADLADMEDTSGNAYKKLKTAFAFRTTYDAQCKCRAHPWEEAARDQHRVYALEARKGKGDQAAAMELKDLTTKIKKAEATAAADRKRAELEKAAELKRLAEEAKALKAAQRAAAKTQPTDIKARAAPDPAAPSTANLWGPKPVVAPAPDVTPPANASATPPLPAGTMSLGAQRSFSASR